MKKIGLLSDTHGYWDDKYATYFGECDEIWHAGDIGSEEVAERLAAVRPLRAVYGNIDGQNLRLMYPKVAHFQVEVHLRPFPHPEGRLRPRPAMPAHQPRRRRQKRLSSATHTGPLRHRRRENPRFGGNRTGQPLSAALRPIAELFDRNEKWKV